ncbi:hypothetical protein BJ912DRAFT_979740 [Pholiota molesta]|nr:hypothetical protein BJ912DRAFT_979740 [Pholiota molesta]
MGDGNFTRLDDENYDAWEFETRAELRRKGVLSLALGTEDRPSGSPNTKAVKAWTTRIDLAAGEIIRRLGPSQFAHVRGYEEDPAAIIIDTPMRTHIANLRNLADKLRALGDAPSDALTIAILFGSLPASYHQLIVSLDSNNQPFSPSSTVSNSHSHNAFATKITDKTRITCFKCGHRGHFQSECPESGPLREIPTTTPPRLRPPDTICLLTEHAESGGVLEYEDSGAHSF